MEISDRDRKGVQADYFNPRTAIFWGVHVGALAGMVALGPSWAGLGLCLLLYAPRMFFVTAGYHRYFSHRSFRTSRAFQFILALGAVASGQKGVLWWAGHHRLHHRHSDGPGDLHSPHLGFWWSHMGWMLSRLYEGTDLTSVKDLARYPELRWLERHWVLPPVTLGLGIWALGGAFALVWGVLVPQVLIWHASFSINSLAHLMGRRRFATRDDSRNSFLLAVVTFGEGWHNNHHHRPGSSRQGLVWWEIDVSYYVLRLLSLFGLVWDLRTTRVREIEPALDARAGGGGEPDPTSC